MAEDITIPPEALEAAAKELYIEWVNFCVTDGGVEAEYPAWEDLDAGDREQWRISARAACLAMLKSWPGMKLNPSWELRTHKRSVEIILPVSEPPKMDRKAAVAERLFGDD